MIGDMNSSGAGSEMDENKPQLHLIDGGQQLVEVCGPWWRVNLLRMDRERVLRGWTRGELARRARVDPGTVSDMFRSRRRPVLGTIQAVSVALDLTLPDVIAFVDSSTELESARNGIRESA